MVDFARSARTAKRLIEKSGRSVTLLRMNRTPLDSTKPWRASATQPHVSQGGAEITVIMAFVQAIGGEGRLGLGKVAFDSPLSLAVAHEEVGIIATNSIPAGFSAADVLQTDTVRDGDEIWKVVQRAELKPGPVSIMFALALTRAR